MIIIEIILTIAAWVRGWRGWALIPGVSVFLIGFMVGAMARAMGHSEIQTGQLTAILLPIELVSVGVLIWMAAKGKRRVLSVAHKDQLETPAVTRTI
jgi:hypothetical protein